MRLSTMISIISHRVFSGVSLEGLALYSEEGLFAIIDIALCEEGLALFDSELVSRSILGALELSHEGNLRRVERVSAEHGYGVLLYKVAMSKYWVAPHESKVSQEAKRVWEQFFLRGEGMREKVESDHPEEYLGYSYRMKVPGVDLAERRYRDLVLRDPYGEKASMILEEIDGRLSNSMRGIYG